jgi:hypothetical protein
MMDELFLRDRISSGAGARIKLLLNDDSVVTIEEKSAVTLSEYVYSTRRSVRKGVLSLLLGGIRTQLNRSGFAEEEFIVRTSNAIAGVKGTDFIVRAPSREATRVFVIDGVVEVRNDHRPYAVCRLTAGLFTEVLRTEPPLAPAQIEKPLMDSLTSQFTLADAVTRPSRGLARAGGASGAAGGASRLEPLPGGQGVTRQVVSPQVSGQLGQEPLVGVAGSVAPPRPAPPAPGPAPAPANPSLRPVLNEVFGSGRR